MRVAEKSPPPPKRATIASRSAPDGIAKFAWEVAMVSKCANPHCSVPFRYLHEGRVFSVRHDPRRHESAAMTVERYWLCSACCDRLTLVLRNGQVSLQPLAPSPSWHTAA